MKSGLLIIPGACVLSLIYGPDNNWDLRSYHLYNAFALLDGRLSRDLFAAGGQSYFNPFIDVPYYVLSVRLIPHWPRLVTFLAGIPLGILALIVLRLARMTFPDRTWLAIVAAAIGLTGTATISEIGTTYGDIPMAVLVLGGLTVPLAFMNARVSLLHWAAAVALAGLLAGIAAGLKPVACIFAPGAALGLAFAAGGPRRFVLTGVAFTLPWIAGFLIAFGPWGLAVYREFGNPVFPLLNHIFASPWTLPVNGTDGRFQPRDIWQAIFYPFFWLTGRPFVVAELGIRDPRFALAYISVAIILLHAVRYRARIAIVGDPAAVLCIFFVVTFIVWEAVFSILRYALTLEVITGILVAQALLILIDERKVVATAAALLIAVFAVSSRPGWGRVKGHDAAVFEVTAPPVPDHTVVVFVAKPMAFVAPFLLGNDLTFVGIDEVPLPSRLGQEIARRIKFAPSIMAVVHGPLVDDAGLTSKFGFRLLLDRCVPIRDNHQRDLEICPGQATAGSE